MMPSSLHEPPTLFPSFLCFWRVQRLSRPQKVRPEADPSDGPARLLEGHPPACPGFIGAHPAHPGAGYETRSSGNAAPEISPLAGGLPEGASLTRHGIRTFTGGGMRLFGADTGPAGSCERVGSRRSGSQRRLATERFVSCEIGGSFRPGCRGGTAALVGR